MKSSEVASGIIRRLLITSRGIQVSGMWPVKLSIPIPDRHNFNLSRFLLSVLSPSFYAFKDSNSSWSADGQLIVFIILDHDRGGTNGLYFYNMSYQTGWLVIGWADVMSSTYQNSFCDIKTIY